MGNGCTAPKGPVYRPGTDTDRHRISLLSEQSSENKRIKIIQAIKKDEVLLLEQELEGLTPTDNVGVKGERFTCFHAAAQWNSFKCLQVLIDWASKTHENKLFDIINAPNKHGYSAPMLAALYDCPECFVYFAGLRLIDFDSLNRNGTNVKYQCETYSPKCVEILKFITESDAKDQQVKSKLLDNCLSSDQLKKCIPRYLNNKTSDEIIKNFVSRTNSLIEENKKNKTNFKDNEFQHLVHALSDDKRHAQYKEFEKAQWKRPFEIMGCEYKDIKVFDKIDPKDIKQGILGVCYLLATLSSLAEYPSRLKSLFTQKEANEQGVYGMNIYLEGMLSEIIIDDYFPCHGDKPTEPLFSKPSGKELWVLLAEKAWAKAFGNYASAEGGLCSDAFDYLLGCPSGEHMIKDESIDEVWANLSRADERKHLMCAATKPKVSESTGIVRGHAYTILGVYHVDDFKIIKLRNPWGSFEWKGKFSDKSEVWTNELKQAVGYQNEDDGVFCMSLKDFRKYFSHYSIGYYEDFHHFAQKYDSSKRHADYFEFEIDERAEVFIRVYQMDGRRLIGDAKKNFKHVPCDCIVAKVEKNGNLEPVVKTIYGFDPYSFVGGRVTYACKSKGLDLDPGKYYLRVKPRWPDGVQRYTLKCSSIKRFEIKKIEPIKDFIPRLLKNHSHYSPFKKDAGNGLEIIQGVYGTWAYVLLKNNNEKNVTMDFKFKLRNLRFPKRNNLGPGPDVHFKLSKGEKQLMFMKKNDIAGNVGLRFNYNYKFE